MATNKTKYLKGEDKLIVSFQNVRPIKASTKKLELEVQIYQTTNSEITSAIILNFKEQMANQIQIEEKTIPVVKPGDFFTAKIANQEYLLMLVFNDKYVSYNLANLATGTLVYAKDIRGEDNLRARLKEINPVLIPKATLTNTEI